MAKSPPTVTLQDLWDIVSHEKRCLLSISDRPSNAAERSRYACSTIAHSLWLTKPLSRQVGVALKVLPDNEELAFHNGNVPWQRVINSKGGISPR